MILEKNTLDASSAIFLFLSAWLYLNVVISIAKKKKPHCMFGPVIRPSLYDL